MGAWLASRARTSASASGLFLVPGSQSFGGMLRQVPPAAFTRRRRWGGGEFPLQALTVFCGSVSAALLRLQEALACEWNAVAVEVAQRWGRSILTRLRLICLMTQGQNNRPPPEKDSEKLVLPLRPLLLCCILPADPAQPLIFLLLLNSQTGFDPDKSPSRPLAPPCHVQRGSESEMEGISASWSVRVKLSTGSG